MLVDAGTNAISGIFMIYEGDFKMLDDVWCFYVLFFFYT